MVSTATRGSRAPALCATTCLSLLCHGTVQAALPSAMEGAPAAAAVSVSNSSTSVVPAGDATGILWMLPPVRLGGTLSYGRSRFSSDGAASSQSSLVTTLNASTNTFIWRPWFAQLDVGLGFSKSTTGSQSDMVESQSTGVVVNGGGQLSVLAQSKFPFTANYEKTDNRISTDFADGNGSVSQRFGFSQRYFRPEGEAMLGWNRSTHTAGDGGGDLQDGLQLRIAHRLDEHRLQFSGDRSVTRHDLSGEDSTQDNLSLQYNFAPDPSFSVASMANFSRSNLHLQQGDSGTRLAQLSSNAFWRAEDEPVTVNGGVRVLVAETSRTDLSTGAEQVGSKVLNANGNVGVNYDYSRTTRMNAAFNVSSAASGGVSRTSMSQALGVSYQPGMIELALAQYNWGVSGNLSNQSGGGSSQRSLGLQMSHSLGRSFKLSGGSTIAVNVTEGLTMNTSTGSTTDTDEVVAITNRQLTHNGSLSWDMSQEAGVAVLRFGVSDSRALDGEREFFQLMNFQASSTLPTSGYTSWNGNLTVQSVRQGVNNAINGNLPVEEGFVTSASGSLSYQNQRLFGVRNLRFGSDMRLNIQPAQSKKPQQPQQSQQSELEARANQVTMAWGNRVDYSIGRTQLRLNAALTGTSVVNSTVDTATGVSSMEIVKKINRSVNFTVSRSFGIF